MSENTPRKTSIGIIGGGQLGLMLIQHGFTPQERKNVFIRVLDPNPECSCSNVADDLIIGSFASSSSTSTSTTTTIDVFEEFLNGLDIVTYELENISLKDLREASLFFPDVKFVPSLDTLEIIQSKVSQKQFYKTNGIPTLPFKVVDDLSKYEQYSGISTKKCVWKSDRGGYDGKGVKQLDPSDMPLDTGLVELSAGKGFKEFSVNVVINTIGDSSTSSVKSGGMHVYEPTRMVTHPELSMLDYCVSTEFNPCSKLINDLRNTAINCVKAFKSDGLFAVEMFLTKDGEVYVNEVAPRPHNSSHPLIHAFGTHNPYKMLADRLMSKELVTPAPYVSQSDYMMKNILGPKYIKQNVKYNILSLTDDPCIHVVDYLKSETRPNRKIGHVTYTNSDKDFYECVDDVISPNTLDNKVLVVPDGGVAVVMGSTSDWNVMKESCEILDKLKVPYAKTVVSAHRTPDRLHLFGKRAREAGLICIIAGAGGAAHLPGMLAAYTELPVIGVPVKSDRSPLQGVDALQSIVQMPPGVPVATVAINGAKNAGILAAQIAGYLDEVRTYKDEMQETVVNNIELQ